MDNLNHILFEEFKHLDKICGELYGDQHGVSHYNDDMKSILENDYRYIPKWKEDLEQLIRIRHIRNYLAHTEGAFEENVCTQKDIEWSHDFYKRILNQSDPLALLRQYLKAKQSMAKAQKPVFQPSTPHQLVRYNVANKKTEEIRNHKDRRRSSLLWIVLFLVIFGGLLLVLSYH